jgi:uncharacterized protein involved in outer membrane biogenesis
MHPEESQENIPSEISYPRLRKTIRILKRILSITLIAVVLLLGGGFALVKFYENDIKAYAVDLMNRRLAAPVMVDPQNIDVSFISTFPYAGIDFKKISATEAWEKKQKEQLFEAEKVSLLFNLFDLLGDKISFKRIEIVGLNIHLRRDEARRVNYKLFKADTLSQGDPSQTLNLERIGISRSRILYTDRKDSFFLGAFLNQADLGGKFHASDFSMDASLHFTLDSIVSGRSAYLAEKNISLAMHINVNDGGNRLEIEGGNCKIEQLGFRLGGNYETVKESGKAFLNLKVEGDRMDLSEALSLIPKSNKSWNENVSGDGDLDFSLLLAGPLDNITLQSEFSLKDGKLKEKTHGTNFENISLKGSFQNKDLKNEKGTIVTAAAFEVNSFSAVTRGNHISGTFRISEFSNPLLKTELKGSADLETVVAFFGSDTLQKVGGKIDLDLAYSGPLPGLKDLKKEDLKKIRISGSAEINDLEFDVKSSEINFRKGQGKLSFRNGTVALEKFGGHVLSTDFLLNGKIADFDKFLLLENHPLVIEAGFSSDFLNLDELLKNKGEQNPEGREYQLVIPEFADLSFETKIGKTQFRKFSASDIKGMIRVKNRKIVLDPVQFSTMDGVFEAAIMADASRPGAILITSDTKISGVNVSKLFSQMENFGQTYLVDRHMSGILNADVQFASVWTPSLEIIPEKVYSRAEVEISRGELIKFEPLIEIAEDLKKDIILRELIDTDEFRKKMEHIRFTTLKNEIEIKKQVITIPRMEVNSTAMNITFSGTHTFKNVIDYHFSFLLSEILTKGKKKRIEQNKEFGVEEDDGTGRVLFYSMKGTTDKYVFKKDYKSKKEKRKEEIKKEKENLRQILRDEFGWFKKDTTQQKKEEPKKRGRFILNWDEGEKKKAPDPAPEDDF